MPRELEPGWKKIKLAREGNILKKTFYEHIQHFGIFTKDEYLSQVKEDKEGSQNV